MDILVLSGLDETTLLEWNSYQSLFIGYWLLYFNQNNLVAVYWKLNVVIYSIIWFLTTASENVSALYNKIHSFIISATCMKKLFRQIKYSKNITIKYNDKI